MTDDANFDASGLTPGAVIDFEAPLGRLELLTGSTVPEGWVVCEGQTLGRMEHDFAVDVYPVPDLRRTAVYDGSEDREEADYGTGPTPRYPWYDPDLGVGLRWITKVRT